MISICMPTYNSVEWLAEAIDSIQRQTYKDWELVIVDDGSTDSSRSLLLWYMHQDKRIRVIFNEKNMGIAYSRNTAIEESKGEYIAVMDSDDIMSPDRLKKSLQAIKKVDFVYAGYLITNEDGHAIQGGYVIPPTKLTIDGVLEGYTAPHVTILAKKELFTKHPYIHKVNDDLKLILEWVRYGYLYKRIKAPLMLVRYRDGSVSRVKDEEIKKITEEMKNEYAIRRDNKK